jgi:hypothetical protein
VNWQSHVKVVTSALRHNAGAATIEGMLLITVLDHAENGPENQDSSLE